MPQNVSMNTIEETIQNAVGGSAEVNTAVDTDFSIVATPLGISKTTGRVFSNSAGSGAIITLTAGVAGTDLWLEVLQPGTKRPSYVLIKAKGAPISAAEATAYNA